MSIDNLLYSEEFYYEHDTTYRQELKRLLIFLGKKLIRPRQFTTEIYSGMDGFLNMTGKLSHRRRYRE